MGNHKTWMEIKALWEITILKGMSNILDLGKPSTPIFSTNVIAQEGPCGRWCKPLYCSISNSSKFKAKKERFLVWVQLLVMVTWGRCFPSRQNMLLFYPKQMGFFPPTIYSTKLEHILLCLFTLWKFCQVVFYVLWKANFLF